MCSFVAIVCARSTTRLGSHSARVLSELYFACTGQIGMHAALPSQRWPIKGFPAAPRGASPSCTVPATRIFPVRGVPFRAWARLDTRSGYSPPGVQGRGEPARGLRHHLVRVAQRDPLHRVLVSAREPHAQLRLVCAVRRDAHRPLGAAVPLLEVVVRERPVHRHAVARLHAEVVRHEARRGAEPVERRAAERAEVGGRERLRSLLHLVAHRSGVPFRMRRMSVVSGEGAEAFCG